MGTLQETIPRQGSNASANYDFRELASGLGYVNYYAVSWLNVSTNTYQLINNTDVYPENTNISQATGTGTFNFDSSTFNLPRTAEGTAVVNFVIRNPDADVCNCRVTAQIQKVASDGTTTTNLSSVFTLYKDGTNGSSALGATTNETVLFFLPLTRTRIKQGEKLRLVITLVVVDAGDSLNAYLDPAGRDVFSDTTRNSRMTLQMPFRIDA